MTPERAALGLGNMLAKNMALDGVVPRRAVKVVLDEGARLREALRLIAAGHISPSMSYAQRVLDGEDPHVALTAEVNDRRGGL